MHPTMSEVAQKVGVSISTVSLVLNDKPGISPELRAQILKAVKEMGYRSPRQNSARLSAESKSIAVVHYAPPESNGQNTPPESSGQKTGLSGLFIDFVASIKEYYKDKNVNWTLITSYRDDDFNNLGYRLLEADAHSPDGLLIIGIPSRKSALVQKLIHESKPAVILSRNWPDLPISTVSQDHARHAQVAIEHLIGLGHRNIAFVARDVDREFDWFDTRLDYYRKKMESLGLWDEGYVSVAVNADEATRELLERRPETTAIFAVHDENAVMVITTLKSLGYRVPQDISVIGLDNSAFPPEGFPSLTTVRFAHDQVGWLAAELLLKQIDNPEISYEKLYVKSWLIERSSCAAPPK